MKTTQCEREFEFSLVLSNINRLTPEITNALFEAGCDDATPSIRYGRMFITFCRTAPSLKDAILSAIKDVKKANLDAEIMRLDECDLVTQSDIARRIDRSRQLVNQYINGDRGDGNFPPPVCELHQKHPLWHWCEVAGWLYENNVIKAEQREEAFHMSMISTALEITYQKKLDPSLTEEIMASIGACPPCQECS